MAALDREVRRDERVVLGRCLREPGQERLLRKVELPDRLVEEHLRRRTDAHGGLAADRSVWNVIEVGVEDPPFAVLALELLG